MIRRHFICTAPKEAQYRSTTLDWRLLMPQLLIMTARLWSHTIRASRRSKCNKAVIEAVTGVYVHSIQIILEVYLRAIPFKRMFIQYLLESKSLIRVQVSCLFILCNQLINFKTFW